MNEINDYQRDQIQDYRIVSNHINTLMKDQRTGLLNLIAPYIEFRDEIENFLADHFSSECTTTCFQNQLSACCAKDSIIIFFADIVVNYLVSSDHEISDLMKCLTRPNAGMKCVYLGSAGCKWRIKPIVCATFLCDKAMNSVFHKASHLKEAWDKFREKEKEFKWPDQPVLFDMLEAYFIEAGFNSPSMYLHNSPGLLRVKRQAGIIS